MRLPHADDESELELDVEPRARIESRVGFLRRLRLSGRTDDRRPADDDGGRAAVVADRQVPPVRKEWLGVGTEQPPEVRRVLERRVEVDVVGDLERKVRSRASRAARARFRRDELVDSRDGVLPRRAPEREERVERARLEDRAETCCGEIENSLTRAEPDARRTFADREHAEADCALHGGSIPSASSSSTGSKKLQLPIEWKSPWRARAISSRDAE